MSGIASTRQDKAETRPPFVGESERRSPIEPPPLPHDRKIGFAVIGLGRLSLDSILPALASSKLGRLAAVMTGDKAKGERVARQYGAPQDAVYGYDEWTRLGENEDVQAVYIVTPNGLHHEQVLAAARRQTCALREAVDQHIGRSGGHDSRMRKCGRDADGRISPAIRAA